MFQRAYKHINKDSLRIASVWYWHNMDIQRINIIGNIFIMVPFGLFLPNVSEKMNRLRYFLLFTIGGILLIEMLQLFGTIGTFDIDDIILNVIGALLGFKYTAGQRNVQ